METLWQILTAVILGRRWSTAVNGILLPALAKDVRVEPVPGIFGKFIHKELIAARI
jgi:hypothetical protein